METQSYSHAISLLQPSLYPLEVTAPHLSMEKHVAAFVKAVERHEQTLKMRSEIQAHVQTSFEAIWRIPTAPKIHVSEGMCADYVRVSAERKCWDAPVLDEATVSATLNLMKHHHSHLCRNVALSLFEQSLAEMRLWRCVDVKLKQGDLGELLQSLDLLYEHPSLDSITLALVSGIYELLSQLPVAAKAERMGDFHTSSFQFKQLFDAASAAERVNLAHIYIAYRAFKTPRLASMKGLIKPDALQITHGRYLFRVLLGEAGYFNEVYPENVYLAVLDALPLDELAAQPDNLVREGLLRVIEPALVRFSEVGYTRVLVALGRISTWIALQFPAESGKALLVMLRAPRPTAAVCCSVWLPFFASPLLEPPEAIVDILDVEAMQTNAWENAVNETFSSACQIDKARRFTPLIIMRRAAQRTRASEALQVRVATCLFQLSFTRQQNSTTHLSLEARQELNELLSTHPSALPVQVVLDVFQASDTALLDVPVLSRVPSDHWIPDQAIVATLSLLVTGKAVPDGSNDEAFVDTLFRSYLMSEFVPPVTLQVGCQLIMMMQWTKAPFDIQLIGAFILLATQKAGMPVPWICDTLLAGNFFSVSGDHSERVLRLRSSLVPWSLVKLLVAFSLVENAHHPLEWMESHGTPYETISRLVSQLPLATSFKLVNRFAHMLATCGYERDSIVRDILRIILSRPGAADRVRQYIYESPVTHPMMARIAAGENITELLPVPPRPRPSTRIPVPRPEDEDSSMILAVTEALQTFLRFVRETPNTDHKSQGNSPGQSDSLMALATFDGSHVLPGLLLQSLRRLRADMASIMSTEDHFIQLTRAMYPRNPLPNEVIMEGCGTSCSGKVSLSLPPAMVPVSTGIQESIMENRALLASSVQKLLEQMRLLAVLALASENVKPSLQSLLGISAAVVAGHASVNSPISSALIHLVAKYAPIVLASDPELNLEFLLHCCVHCGPPVGAVESSGDVIARYEEAREKAESLGAFVEDRCADLMLLFDSSRFSLEQQLTALAAICETVGRNCLSATEVALLLRHLNPGRILDSVSDQLNQSTVRYLLKLLPTLYAHSQLVSFGDTVFKVFGRLNKTQFSATTLNLFMSLVQVWTSTDATFQLKFGEVELEVASTIGDVGRALQGLIEGIQWDALTVEDLEAILSVFYARLPCAQPFVVERILNEMTGRIVAEVEADEDAFPSLEKALRAHQSSPEISQWVTKVVSPSRAFIWCSQANQWALIVDSAFKVDSFSWKLPGVLSNILKRAICADKGVLQVIPLLTWESDNQPLVGPLAVEYLFLHSILLAIHHDAAATFKASINWTSVTSDDVDSALQNVCPIFRKLLVNAPLKEEPEVSTALLFLIDQSSKSYNRTLIAYCMKEIESVCLLRLVSPDGFRQYALSLDELLPHLPLSVYNCEYSKPVRPKHPLEYGRESIPPVQVQKIRGFFHQRFACGCKEQLLSAIVDASTEIKDPLVRYELYEHVLRAVFFLEGASDRLLSETALLFKSPSLPATGTGSYPVHEAAAAIRTGSTLSLVCLWEHVRLNYQALQYSGHVLRNVIAILPQLTARYNLDLFVALGWLIRHVDREDEYFPKFLKVLYDYKPNNGGFSTRAGVGARACWIYLSKIPGDWSDVPRDAGALAYLADGASNILEPVTDDVSFLRDLFTQLLPIVPYLSIVLPSTGPQDDDRQSE